MHKHRKSDAISRQVSKDAHMKATEEPHLSVTLQKMIDVIKRAGRQGMTCDEVEVALAMPHQTCSARFRDLKEKSLIIPNPRVSTRKTRRGSSAVVWIVA